MTELESLAQSTIIVADTGDIESIARLQPRDATTNPSLILKAASDPKYRELVRKSQSDSHTTDEACDRVLVAFGSEIIKYIPGRVSTEVDARYSFDSTATINKARRIISLYEEAGFDRERILIKIAATWEGTEACRVLQQEGIHCNMTLIFSLAQALQSSDAKATLISPFVGRVYDWYKKTGRLSVGGRRKLRCQRSGVKAVHLIYERLKGSGSKTEVMGASFRNKKQILALTGCDLLTISPKLLDELSSSEGHVQRQLDPAKVQQYRPESFTESISVLLSTTIKWLTKSCRKASGFLSKTPSDFRRFWRRFRSDSRVIRT